MNKNKIKRFLNEIITENSENIPLEIQLQAAMLIVELNRDSDKRTAEEKNDEMVTNYLHDLD